MSLADTYSEAFDGFFIYDCALRSSGYCFILVETTKNNNDREPNKRIVGYFPDYEGQPVISWHEYRGFENPHLVIASSPKEQAVMVGLSGAVAVLGSGESAMQDYIPGGDEQQPIFGTASACTSINGYLYVAGGWRHVAKRVDANQWLAIHDRRSMPHPTSKNGSSDGGFNGISAFSEEDIYCVGGKGDVWRFDGKKWHQCPMPTNMRLWSVCCAGDGFVYIGAQSGSIIKGRGNNWKVIHQGDLTLPFKDMVWFDNKLWSTSDYGLWTVENDQLIESDLPSDVIACSGNLAVGYGKLLLAGLHGATVYDGKKWERLV
ncbi:hypothetical protein ABHF33_03625 [Chitinibacter sp. FCG-7]|uniref:Uncharacterized protein n=1 Tax=Chitinibacter mangrovi TaxID=3153927 RepID=A0AAU7FBF6_9NEIS